MADISAFIGKIISSWNHNASIVSGESHICDLVSDNGTETELRVLFQSSLSRTPVQVKDRACFKLNCMTDAALQPKEWRALHFGLRFVSDYALTGQVSTLVPGLSFRNGLSYVDGILDVTSSEMSFIVQNTTRK